MGKARSGAVDSNGTRAASIETARHGRNYLEVEAQLRRQRARRDEVRSAERGLEIVEGDFICHVDCCEAQAPLVAFLVVKEIVISQADIE